MLEGFHALKHALRFGAAVEFAATPDRAAALRLAGRLAPDVADRLCGLLREVPAATFASFAPAALATGIVAVARRPKMDPAGLLTTGRHNPWHPAALRGSA
ncbi:MAG TPA: hypothetical protein VFY87_31205, partial [Geminicoccaceae bacterium]|nr:hypothetical protein [Geminicoccaceae bacterium]